MATLNPYIHFPGTCREAMAFYKDIFGGELTLMTIGESPVAAQMPDMKDGILHSQLQSKNLIIMASDMGPANPKDQMTELCLVCESKDEIESLYAKLSAGGKIIRALGEEFFGTFAQFTDKFGVNWMMQYGMGKK